MQALLEAFDAAHVTSGMLWAPDQHVYHMYKL
jgi:hypothetical protein